MRSPGFVGSAIGRRNGVAIGVDEAVLARQPGDRPFERAVTAGLGDLAEERLIDDQLLALDVEGEKILQAAGKAEHRLGGDLGVDEGGRATPADFDAAEQIGFRARHLE